jgi:hypothetical protein
MAITSSKPDSWRKEPRDNDCKENDTATQKTINKTRRKYCDTLYETAGEVSKWEKSNEGYLKLYEQKKCMFVWTETNYQRYRNTEISIGTELIQSNINVKENITNYIKWGTDLSTGLKNISKAVKEVKARMNDLRESAGKLENCKNDSCNCTQLMILTGKVPENCKGESKPSKKEHPKECADVDKLLCDLICMPKALGFDIDSIYKSSAETIGIQVFSNINTLDPLHKTLSDHAKAFGSHLQLTMKTRETDMKKMQEDLIKCLQETTKATASMYNKRSDFEGIMETLNYVCCPVCDCVQTNKICDPRLPGCEDEICEICDEIKKTFCLTEESEQQKAAY